MRALTRKKKRDSVDARLKTYAGFDEKKKRESDSVDETTHARGYSVQQFFISLKDTR